MSLGRFPLSSCAAARILALLLIGTVPLPVFGAEPPPKASRVLKLTHLAVILPELEETRVGWEPGELWTPTVEQVAKAERAITQRLREMEKEGAKVNLKAHYIIQYYGVTIEKKKWIVCSVLDLAAIGERHADEHPDLLAETLDSVLTAPYEETDSDKWFDAFVDPTTNRFSESHGDLKNRVPRETGAKGRPATDVESGRSKVVPEKGGKRGSRQARGL